MAKQSLIDRVADKKSEDLETEEPDVDSFVDEVRVSESAVEYRNLDDDNWNFLASVEEIAESSFSNMIQDKDIILSEEQKSKLEDFSALAGSCWDAELEMFRIEYQTDEDGDLKSLVVPLESDISEDFVVQEIHDNEGNFVAEDIEEQVDLKMYELWSTDMYVNSLDGESDVYIISDDTKSRIEIFSDSVSNQSESFDAGSYLDQSTATEWLVKTLLSVIGTLGMLSLFYFTFQSLGILGSAFLFVFSMFGMIPLLVIMTTLLEIIIGITALSTSIKDKREYRKVKLFHTTD